MSTQPRERIGALLIGPETGFGAGANPAHLGYFRARNIARPAGREIKGTENRVQGEGQDVPSILRQPGELSFEMDVYCPTSTFPTVAAPEPTFTPFVSVAAALLGDEDWCPVLATVIAGCTTTVLKFDTAYGAAPSVLGFSVGDPIFVRASGSDRVLGFNCVQEIDDVLFTVTLRSPLPSAPAAGALVYGAAYAPLEADYDLPSYEVVDLGDKVYNRQRHLGNVVSNLTLNFPFRDLASMAVTMQCALPVPPEAAEAGGSPAKQAWTLGNGGQVIDGGLYLWDGSTNHKIAGGLEIDLGAQVVERPGVHGIDPNGIGGYDRVVVNPVVKIQPNYLSNELFTLADTEGQTFVLTFWAGRGARCVGLQMPASFISKFPELTARDGVMDLTIELGMQDYAGDGTGSGSNKNCGLVVAALAKGGVA